MGSTFRSVSISTANVVDVNTGDQTAIDDGLVSRLAVIEGEPLEARAAAYVELHDQLRHRLEGGDAPAGTNG